MIIINLFNLFAKISLDDKDFKKGIDGAEQAANKLQGGLAKIGTGVAKIGSVVSKGVMAAGAGLTAIGGIGLKFNSDMEGYMTNFEVMLGSAEKATNHVADLQKLAAKTPFEMTELADASNLLLSFGNDVNDVIPYMQMLGDISLGNKDKFQGLALAFSQMSATGKLTGEDLNQMIERGFNPLKIISEQTGKSMSDLKEEVSDGAISFEMVADAMKVATSEGGLFYQGMEKQSQTLNGMLSTLKDNLINIAGKIVTPLFNKIKTGLQNFMPLLNNVSNAVDDMFKRIENGQTVTMAFYDAFENILGKEMVLAISNFIGVFEFGLKGLIAIIKGDTEEARGLFYAMFPDNAGNMIFVDMIVGTLNAIRNLVLFLKDNLDAITKVTIFATTTMATFVGTVKLLKILGAINTLIKAYQTGTVLATLAQWGLNTAMLANPMTWVAAAIAVLVGGITYLVLTNENLRYSIVTAWENIKNAGVLVWQWLVNFFTVDIPNAWNSTINFFSKVPSYFVNLWNEVANIFKTTWNNITNYVSITVTNIINFITQWFAQLPYKLGYSLGYSLATIIKWGVDSYNYIITNVPIWINKIGEWFGKLPSIIGNWLTNAYKNVVSWGVNTYNSLISYSSSAINSVINWFATLPGRIAELLSLVISRVVQFGTNLYSRAVEAGRNMATGLIGVISELPSKMYDIGVNMIKGVWNGIVGMKDWLLGKAGDFFGGIVQGIKDKLDINSPSRVMRDEVGVFMAQGIGVGFDEEMDSVNADIQNSLMYDFDTPTASNQTDKTDVMIGLLKQLVSKDTSINIDGRETMRVLSQYQDELDLFNSRNPRFA